jgi:hypothetical protein
MVVAVATIGLTGCLSSGGDDNPAPAATPTPSTTLTGAAVAAAINGQACAYKLSDSGVEGEKLNCATTNPTTGAYSITFSNYAGDVLIKAFGSYTDEATGLTKSILEASPIRAIVACATAGTSCDSAVTPLTEAALKSAASLKKADVDEAYRKVAEAFGLKPTSTDDAVKKLARTKPNQGTRADDDATKYGDILAVASQAQKRYCGDSTTCSLDNYLAGVKDLLGTTGGIASLQSTVNAALTDWNSNPLNKSKVSCSLTSGTVTCNLPTGSSSSSSGTYKLTVTVAVGGIGAGVAIPAIVINNVPKPDSQSAFCANDEVQKALDSVKNSSPGASLVINSCSFSGSQGSISLTLSLTSPIALTVPYTANYVYTQN